MLNFKFQGVYGNIYFLFNDCGIAELYVNTSHWKILSISRAPFKDFYEKYDISGGF